ncbi:DNA topology modulation protein [Legionella busanensis]|uniref:DNA topology modulation protein n=1 Tax=Legionella busanensis TaxID=190655 RepID=A0A378JMQ8_9GAMM|nr:DNA topology modulation protein [Legionella busanensis]STX51310.1 DNA topology modulation protein [Legionella busanensis]
MPHRIMIMGRSGSGKSTFAYQLHQQTHLPLYHLDKYFFTDYWVERNYQEFLSIQQSFVNQEQWIIDGNSTKSFEMRYKRATLCLYFNYPKMLCYWRVLKRFFYKDKRIDDRATNCHEKVSWSLLKYMWGFEKRVQTLLKQLQQNYPQTLFIEIHSDRELKQFSQLFLIHFNTNLKL